MTCPIITKTTKKQCTLKANKTCESCQIAYCHHHHRSHGCDDKERSRDDLDRFYTRPDVVLRCIGMVDKLFPLVSFDVILEPSAGSGSFFNQLPPATRLGIDIAPATDNVREADFMSFTPPEGKTLVIGNPPFGRVSSLAVMFFNRAATFATVIAFIIPRIFKKLGLQTRLDDRFHLIHSEDLGNGVDVFEPAVSARCCFQIWQRKETKRINPERPSNHEDFVFCKLSEAEFAVRQVGSNPGMVVQEGLTEIAERSFLFIKTTGKTPLNEVIQRIKSIEFSFAYDSVRIPSFGRADLVEAYDALRED
jgi:hypothetical protein